MSDEKQEYNFDEDFAEEGEDEFFDDVEDEEFLEEDWEASDGEFEEVEEFDEEAAVLAEQKRKRFNNIVIAGAVVVGGIIFVLQVMGGGSNNSAVVSQPTDVASVEAVPQGNQGQDFGYGEELLVMSADETQVQSSTEPAKQGMLHDLSQLPGFEDEDMSDFVPRQPQGEDSLTALTPLPQDVVDVTPQKQQPIVQQPVVQPVQEQASIDTETLNSLKSLDDKLTMIFDRMDVLELKLQDAQEKQSVEGGPDYSEQIANLEDSIRSLEAMVAKVVTEQKETRAELSEVKKEKKRTASYSSPSSQPVMRSRSPQWVLKGAQPGRAYLSDKTTKNMHNVKVGDTLKGIGRITSIAQQDGQWVVKGTAGQVSQ